MRFLALFVAYAVVFLACDAVWLSVMGSRFYRRQLGELMLPTPNFSAAAAFYIIYMAGLVVLVGIPAGTDAVRALGMGAMLGFVAYATYDLTNLATIRGFTPTLAVVDIVWGTVLSAVTSAIGVWIVSRFMG